MKKNKYNLDLQLFAEINTTTSGAANTETVSDGIRGWGGSGLFLICPLKLKITP